MSDAAISYYAQKELIYRQQALCTKLYIIKCDAETNWTNACQELYALENKAKELAEGMFE